MQAGTLMERRAGAILFDMDNTLHNFVDAKIRACSEVVGVLGEGDGMDLFRYFLRNIHGFEHHDNIRDYMHDRRIWHEDRFSLACTVYEQVKLEHIKPYPLLHETLTLIRDEGIPMAVVTDAESFQAKRRLAKIGVTDFFQHVISPDISGKRKPEPDSFILALRLLDVRPEHAWVVGDSLRREIAPGKQLGMTTVYARYGDWLGIPSPSVRPDHVLNELSELTGLLGLKKRANSPI